MDAAPPAPDHQATARPSVFWPLAVWLAIQLGAIALAAARVPFSARYPSPEELLAVHVVVLVQVTAAAMLFPFILRTPASASVAAASSIPFIQLAAMLAAQTDNARLAWCALYVALWLTSLAVLNAALTLSRQKMHAVAASTFLALGGSTLSYLHREFGNPTAAFDWSAHAWLGPVMGVLAILEGNPASGTIWIFLGASLPFALLCLGFARWKSRRRFAEPETAPPLTTDPPATA